MHREAALLCVDQVLDILGLARCFGAGAGHQRIHEFQRGLRCFRHLVTQFPCCMIWIAEQLGPPRTQLCQTGDIVTRIVGVSALSAVPGFLKDGFTGGPDT